MQRRSSACFFVNPLPNAIAAVAVRRGHHVGSLHPAEGAEELAECGPGARELVQCVGAQVDEIECKV